MRRIHLALLLTAALPVAAAPALAGGDKASVSFTNHTVVAPGGEPFSNCSSTGAFKSSGTAISIQLKGLINLPDTDQVACSADEVICVVHTNNKDSLNGALINGVTSIVFYAEVKKGQVKIKHDICAENVATCLPIQVSSSELDVECFMPEADFDPTEGGLVGNLPLANGCDVVAVGDVEPASQLIAEGGSTTGCP